METTLARTDDRRSLYDPLKSFFDFDNFFPSWVRQSQNALPAVNVSEDEKTYFVDVVAPGFKKNDFKVKVEDDMLTIAAETKSETNGKSDGATGNKQYSRREYSYSSFTRSFRLPDNAKDDGISANYEDGVLKLSIPKSKQSVKSTKEIPIK